jgi:UDP-N-acetylmuramoyl-tripeptide--D-alanyl-D-alanine ligase
MKEEDQLSVAMVLEATKGVLMQGDAGTSFAGVSTDSRSIEAGELFFALRGEHFDGHRFLAKAIQQGGKGAVVEQEVDPPANHAVALIRVADTLQALGDLAHLWRERHPIPLVAVVGSNGKTTTKEMAAAVLRKRYKVMKNTGNLNNLIGLPLSLLQINSTDGVAILEMGMNRKGEILRLTQIAAPDLGILTNIAPAHLEGLGSIEGIMEAKGELSQGMGASGRLIFNADDPRVVELSRQFDGNKTSFGVEHHADWRATNIAIEGDGKVSFRMQGPAGETPVSLRLLGRHQVYNALAAAAAASPLGAVTDDIKEGLEGFAPPVMRMELLVLGTGIKIINDAYNANPRSMEAALFTLQEQTGGRKIAVLGDMWELGAYAEKAHHELGRTVHERGINRLFLLGRFASQVATGAREAGMDTHNISIGKDHHAVAQMLAQIVKTGDWVLVKGSRIMRMEEVIKELKDALHEKNSKALGVHYERNH